MKLSKRTKRTKKYNGGSEAVPFESLGFSHGASSASQQAMLVMKDRNEQQNAMNKMSGGRSKSKRSKSKRSKSKRSNSKRMSMKKHMSMKKRMSKKRMSMKKRMSKKRTRRMKGGEITVPQFPQPGNIPQAYSSTELSKGGNYTTAVGASNAEFDCYATNSCPK